MSLDTNTAKPTSNQPALGQMDQLQSFDLIGIGFGPANLSLSVRLAEENLAISSRTCQSQTQVTENDDRNHLKPGSLKTCFIESNDSFRWHPGMMVSLSSNYKSFSSFAHSSPTHHLALPALRFLFFFLSTYSRDYRSIHPSIPSPSASS